MKQVIRLLVPLAIAGVVAMSCHSNKIRPIVFTKDSAGDAVVIIPDEIIANEQMDIPVDGHNDTILHRLVMTLLPQEYLDSNERESLMVRIHKPDSGMIIDFMKGDIREWDGKTWQRPDTMGPQAYSYTLVDSISYQYQPVPTFIVTNGSMPANHPMHHGRLENNEWDSALIRKELERMTHFKTVHPYCCGQTSKQIRERFAKDILDSATYAGDLINPQINPGPSIKIDTNKKTMSNLHHYNRIWVETKSVSIDGGIHLKDNGGMYPADLDEIKDVMIDTSKDAKGGVFYKRVFAESKESKKFSVVEDSFFTNRFISYVIIIENATVYPKEKK